jgi:hypothetical protein
MKIILSLFVLIFLFTSCQDAMVKKPDNLIDEGKMIDIIYDLALIEGIKSQDYLAGQSIKSNDYIYKKYKVDSIQFAKSTQFYASDVTKYKKMYTEVGKRIDENKAKIDTLISRTAKQSLLKKKSPKLEPIK